MKKKTISKIARGKLAKMVVFKGRKEMPGLFLLLPKAPGRPSCKGSLCASARRRRPQDSRRCT